MKQEIVFYKLKPADRPVHPEKLWSGKVMRCYRGYDGDYLLVELIEPGYEGIREIITRNQIQQSRGSEVGR